MCRSDSDKVDQMRATIIEEWQRLRAALHFTERKIQIEHNEISDFGCITPDRIQINLDDFDLESAPIS